MVFDPLKAKCRKRGCEVVVPSGDIVCEEHDGYRCNVVMPHDSNHVEARRCRGPSKPGEPCWRHRG